MKIPDNKGNKVGFIWKDMSKLDWFLFIIVPIITIIGLFFLIWLWLLITVNLILKWLIFAGIIFYIFFAPAVVLGTWFTVAKDSIKRHFIKKQK